MTDDRNAEEVASERPFVGVEISAITAIGCAIPGCKVMVDVPKGLTTWAQLDALYCREHEIRG